MKRKCSKERKCSIERKHEGIFTIINILLQNTKQKAKKRKTNT